jgi:hypothetical protein
MSFLHRPNRGLTPDLCATNLRSEIARIDHIVFTQAPCDLAWKIFSDWKLWPRFSDIYGPTIQWQGAPWQPGSRMLIDIVQPLRAKVDRVITICTPPRCVAWINHVRGYTMEQWVLFDPYVGGGTKVSTWIELTGADMFCEGKDTPQIVKACLDKWFGNFCAECDRVAEGI